MKLPSYPMPGPMDGQSESNGSNFMNDASQTYIDCIPRQGFAVIEGVLDPATINLLTRELATARIDNYGSLRAGKAFGLTNLLNAVPVSRRWPTAMLSE
ncbi:MAG TPA: hypothetical protein VF075_10660 [Pyrinomonadaceae bacterium]